MIHRTIEYTDYNGVARKETFYFNLTEAEVLDMEMSEIGGYAEMIKRVVESKDQVTLIAIFKKFITSSYGVKSADGRRFMKSPEILADFTETPAYSKLYMKLATDAAAAAEFVRGIIPANMGNQPAAPALTPVPN